MPQHSRLRPVEPVDLHGCDAGNIPSMWSGHNLSFFVSSVGLSVCHSVGPSVCRSVGLSVCRSAFPSACSHTHIHDLPRAQTSGKGFTWAATCRKERRPSDSTASWKFSHRSLCVSVHSNEFRMGPLNLAETFQTTTEFSQSRSWPFRPNMQQMQKAKKTAPPRRLNYFCAALTYLETTRTSRGFMQGCHSAALC